MNRNQHLAMWNEMRMRHGITLRLLDQIPDEQLTRHPIPGMRTPVELVVHMYDLLQHLQAAVIRGRVEPGDEQAAAKVTNRAQLLAYVRNAWAAADRSAQAVTDAQLAATVETPWGKAFPGFAISGFCADDYVHHRGQLYAFVRTYGLEPVFVWSYDQNAAEFQPRAHAAS